MKLTISTKERLVIAEQLVTGLKCVISNSAVVNAEPLEIKIQTAGVPFFFDLFGDQGEWVGGGRLSALPPVTPESTILMKYGDLQLMTR